MRYLCLLTLVFIGVTFTAHGQQALKAQVLEEKSRLPLAGIKVENIRNKKTAETDKAGRFSIDAALNDVLVLQGFAYEVDTVLVTKLAGVEILMLPKQNMLKEVQVENMQVTKSLKVYDKDYHNQTVQYSMDEHGNYKGGVTFRIWSNKAEERKMKKLQDLEFKYKMEAVIDTGFSAKRISQMVPLKGEELTAFCQLYRPTTHQYASKNFNLLDYVNDCYKKFMALPPGKRRLEPLNR